MKTVANKNTMWTEANLILMGLENDSTCWTEANLALMDLESKEIELNDNMFL